MISSSKSLSLFRPLIRSFSSSSAVPTSIIAAVARSSAAPFSIEKLNLRSIRSDEILVKILASGVCHTDIVCKEKGFVPFPIVLGHEGAGIVESIGSSVSSVAPGDRVLLSYASCGFCPHCAIGKPAYCYSHGSLNFAGSHADGSLTHADPKAPNSKVFGSFFQQSSFASHAIVTANNSLRISSDLDLYSLAPLGCGVQTGAGAVLNSLAVKPGDSIGVWGCGAVGLSSIMAAKLVRASVIVAVDLSPRRLEMALELGATHTILATGTDSDKSIAAQVKAICPPGLQYSLDTSGNKFALRAGFDSLRPMGVAALIGGSAAEVSIPMGDLLHGRSVRGIVQGDSVSRVFLPKLIDLWQSKQFPVHKLVTFYDGIDKIDNAFADAKNVGGEVIKPVIKIANL